MEETVTDLIDLSPSAMQIVGAFEILSVVVGWSSFECSLLVIEIQACEFVGLAEFRFCQDFSRTFSSKETLSAVELTPTFKHHPRNFSIVCDSPKSAWNSQQCKITDSPSRAAPLTLPDQAYSQS